MRQSTHIIRVVYEKTRNQFWLSYGLLILAGGAMYAPYGPFFAIIPELLPKNVAGGAMALINSFGALGSFIGAYIVGYLNGSTGGFGASYIFMAGSLFLSALITLIAVKSPTSAQAPVPVNAIS